MKTAYFLILLLFGTASCYEFYSFEGKIADPCARYTDPARQKDCMQDSQWPAASSTVLIPSISSTPVTGGTPIGTNLRTTTLTISGNFPFPQTGTWALALATSEDSCSKIDFRYQYIPILPANIFPNQILFNLQTGLAFQPTSVTWDDISLEIEDRPRLLCFTDNLIVTNTLAADPNTNPVNTGGTVWRYTGFKIGTVWNCGDSTTTSCGSTASVSSISSLLTPLQTQLRLQRTYCCKRDTRMTLLIPGTASSPSFSAINAGQCINPNVQTCCGAASVEIAHEKCCNPTFELVSQIDGLCPCSATSDCTTSERCCLPLKYSQLTLYSTQSSTITVTNLNNAGTLTTTTSVINPSFLGNFEWPFFRGQCYRPTEYHCCDTGSVFDPGTQQCCRINGVQSINTPCPCGQDTDCITQSQPLESRTYNFTCCMQTAVTPVEASGLCSIYANYPSGQGAPEIQRCLGVCINPNYQFCCNGAVCMASYERCCNSTCCNIWTSTCFYALRPGARGSRYNFFNWAQTPFAIQEEIYEQCSSIEHLTTTKGFWIFVWPAMLLLVSHLGLALVLVFAAKATPRSFSKIELLMMGVALLNTYFAMPLFFAPVWKYGVWIIFAQLIVFLTATARIHWLNILCLVVQFVTLVYVYDPFHGNAYLTLSSQRLFAFQPTAAGMAPDDLFSSGLLHAETESWHTTSLVSSLNFCVNFYDYFSLDPNLRDIERYDNLSITTFGYCSRGWVTALLIFSFFNMMGLLIQLILTLLGLFYRFHTDSILEQGYYEPTSAPEAEQYYYQ